MKFGKLLGFVRFTLFYIVLCDLVYYYEKSFVSLGFRFPNSHLNHTISCIFGQITRISALSWLKTVVFVLNGLCPFGSSPLIVNPHLLFSLSLFSPLYPYLLIVARGG